MGKSKEDARFVNREIYQRVNFLFQAAKLVLRQDRPNFDLCKYYISTMRTVAEKHVIRVHPKIKRAYCKCCNILLVSGLTCRIRCRSKNETHTVVTCLLCGTMKRFMWRREHQLWMDRPEAWLPSVDKSGRSRPEAPLASVDKSGRDRPEATLTSVDKSSRGRPEAPLASVDKSGRDRSLAG